MSEVENLLNNQGPGTISQTTDFAQNCPSLSIKQRIWGFAICFVTGLVLGIIGAFMLFVNVIAFAVLYTIGNILGIISTGFLVGPLKQIKNMLETHRLIATLAFLISMGLTLFAAFYFGNSAAGIILSLLFMLIQWVALIWYSLSYIPFARNIIKSCARGMCDF